MTTTVTRAERLSDLLAITSRLIACMEREIELLRAMRPADIAALLPGKDALADAYEAHLRALHATAPDEDDPVGRALRDDLIRATERFQEVVTDNARALKAVKAANDRVLKAIVEAVERKRGTTAAYTATGAASGADGPSGSAPPMCLAVDRRL